MAKGFQLVNQKVVLDLDLSGNATGYTELTIQPLVAQLTTVYLHSRECRIKSVSLVNGSNVATGTGEGAGNVDATTSGIAEAHAGGNASSASDSNLLAWHLSTPVQTAVATPCNSTNIRSAYPELKRRLYQATNEAEEGELAIVLPAGTVRKAGATRNDSLAPLASGAVDGANSPDPNAKTPGGGAGGDKSRGQDFEPVTLIIDYDIRNPKDGIHVVRPSDLYPSRIPHCYTSSAVPDAARCWVPCVDNLWERCSWELVLSVPRLLSYEQDTEQGLEIEEFPVVCVASGELIEQVTHPHNPNKTIFHYMQANPTTVQHVGFAWGPFSILDLTHSAKSAGGEGGDDLGLDDPNGALAAIAAETEGKIQMHAFCLPGREDELANSTTFMTKALEFLLEEFGSYPFSSYKLVFVDECPFSMFNTAALGIFNTDLLHPQSVIDQAYETRQALAYSLAAQWIGINIIQKTWADTWLIQGLSLHINALILKRLMGNNEYRFRLKKDVQRCCAWDVKMAPLCQPGVMQPPAADYLPFMNLKAPLVLHILDRQLLKAGTHNGLSRIIPKLLLSAISGDLKENLLSTHNFLRMCRKVSGSDLRGFAEQWIYAGGCPRFHIAATFNRKRMAVELAIKQDSPAYSAYMGADWTEKAALRPVQVFEGQMTVRIHEADGTPYEHVIDIRDTYKKHEVGFNTKYKRIRRSTKRFQARKAQEEAAAAGDTEAIEAVGMIDTSFSLPLWEDSKDPNTEKRRESWKVQDWSAEDEKNQEAAVYEWIRIDTEFEWLAQVHFEQPDFMWLSQLQRDRDVVAQMEAVHALAGMRTPVVSSNLAKTALVTNYFYRIRMEAVLALVATATQKNDFLGLFYLLKIFQSRYCYEPERETSDPFAFRCVPRPNDFTDFAEYHLRKTIVIALSHVRDDQQAIPQVTQLLIDLLKYNDNSSNTYTDAFYLTCVIAALGSPFASGSFRELDDSTLQPHLAEEVLLRNAVDEVTRYTNLDKLVPSYHNLITVAAIEWRVKMMMSSMIPLDLPFMLAYTREGNYPTVRSAAFEGLLLSKALQEKIIARYILAVLRFDSCRIVQRRLAQALVENLPVLAAMDELGNGEGAGGDDEQAVGKKMPKDTVEGQLKALRNSVGRSIMLRDSIMAVLLAPNVDIEIRWCLLKLCEVLIKPSEEPLPKIKLRMPVRLPSSAAPGNKAGSPEVPLSASTGIPKIKFGGQEVLRRDSLLDSPGAGPLKLVLGNKKGQASSANGPKLLREQKGGMSMSDLKVSQNLMQKLTATKKADLFRRPVDPIRDMAPSYFEHIKQPMDLSTMGGKLDAGMYKDRFGLRDDFKLMINNCYLFNGTESLPGQLAATFDAYFDKQWDRANTTLETLRIKSAQASTPSTAAPAAAAPFRISIPPSQQPPSETPKPAAEEETFAVPQPPTPAAHPAASSGSLAPLRLKLSFGASASPSNQMPPPLPTPTGDAATANGDPAKRSRSQTPAGAVNGNGDARPPSRSATPNAAAFEREASRPPLSRGPSRSSSPAVPLSAMASAQQAAAPVPSSASVGSFKLKLSARAKPEPIDEQVDFAAPHPPRPQPRASPQFSPPPPAQDPPSREASHPLSQSVYPSQSPAPPVAASEVPLRDSLPPPSSFSAPSPGVTASAPRQPSASADPGPPKAKKIRLSINGMNSFQRPSPSPSASEQAPKPPAPAASPAPHQAAPSNPVPIRSAPPQREPVRSASVSSSVGETASMPVNYKKMSALVKKLLHMEESFFFQRPVDPIRDGCPTYYQEIKRPMDLGTLQANLDSGRYQLQGELNDDFEQIVINAKIFNPPNTLPVVHAETLQKTWRAEVAKANKLSYQERRSLQGMMNRLKQRPAAAIFLEPVDPIALGIPMYFQVIPKQDARDLSLIKRRLDNDEYTNFDSFEADFRLMINNCLVFNGEGSPAYEVGRNLEAEFEREFDMVKSQLGAGSNGKSAKRQSTGGPEGGGTIKKIKIR